MDIWYQHNKQSWQQSQILNGLCQLNQLLVIQIIVEQSDAVCQAHPAHSGRVMQVDLVVTCCGEPLLLFGGNSKARELLEPTLRDE